MVYPFMEVFGGLTFGTIADMPRMVECPRCEGKRYHYDYRYDRAFGEYNVCAVRCETCNGSGVIAAKPQTFQCPICHKAKWTPGPHDACMEASTALYREYAQERRDWRAAA